MRVNWFKIIVDLQQAGLPHKKLAKEIRVCHRTILNWKQQICEPPYSKGAALLDIYNTVMGKST